MKKRAVMLLAVAGIVTFSGCSGNNRKNATEANRRYQGRIETYQYGDMILHSYTSPREQLPDLSFIIEGENSVVVLEQPSLPDGITEFKEYLASLNKPLVKVISSYHTNALKEWDPSSIVMIEGMPESLKAQSNGEEEGLPPANISVVPANSTQTWADIDFQFIPSMTGAPSADVIIAGRVYYMHGAPGLSHMRGIRDRETIDKQLAYFRGIGDSGYELIIGSHGAAARGDMISFQIAYLEKMKDVLAVTNNKEDFIKRMRESFYGIGGENNLTATADNIFQ